MDALLNYPLFRSSFPSQEEKNYKLVTAIEENKGLYDIQTLINSGANPNPIGISNTPLCYAIFRDRIDVVSLLLKKGANPNIKNGNGNTSLHAAVNHNRVEMILLLLEHGADPNEVTFQGDTPICAAINRGFFTIVSLLFEKGANKNIKNHQGISPYMLFLDKLKKGQANKELLYCFLPFLTPDEIEDTIRIKPDLASMIEAFKTESSVNLLKAVTNNHPKSAKFFINAGARLDILDKDKNTVLHWAAYHGNIGLVKYFLENKVDPTLKGAMGCTPLHFAAQQGHITIVELLTEANKACVFSKDDNNDNPLHLACLGGHVEATAFLLYLGADKNCLNKENKTPLILASEKKHADVFFCLLANMSYDEVEQAKVNVPNFPKNMIIFQEEFSKQRDTLFLIFKDCISREIFYPQGLPLEILAKLVTPRFPVWFQNLIPKLLKILFKEKEKNNYLPSFSTLLQDIEMQKEVKAEVNKRKHEEDNKGPDPKKIKKDP